MSKDVWVPKSSYIQEEIKKLDLDLGKTINPNLMNLVQTPLHLKQVKEEGSTLNLAEMVESEIDELNLQLQETEYEEGWVTGGQIY